MKLTGKFVVHALAGTAFFFVGTMSRVIAGPLSPAESLKAFKTAADVEIKLVASEPQVIDPVDLAFDEQDRLWVAEMRDYPNGPKPGDKPSSIIKILRDKNGDGIYETATVFADQLLFVTGVLPWKGGVIVTLAGQVVWMIDDNGDDKMDRQEVWLEGFAQENPQLRANHPTLGSDGWIYVANGLRGGEVSVVHPDWPKPKEPISLRGKDFRFHPETGVCEAIAGNGQYGMSFDAWGNRLICSNRNPAMQVMFQFDDLAHQPLLIVPSLVNDISPSGADSRLFPLTGNWTTSNLHAGQFTAACGVHSYQGTGLPLYKNHVFCCDPTANLVHGDELAISGATFRAVQPHQEKEFLASTDPWFRPVNLKTGPDGALYVADMYRAVIEHPQFMPEELKNRPDLVLGNDRGRIWKVSAKTSAAAQIPKADTVTTDEKTKLLAWLNHPNIWQRQTAFRLIMEQGCENWMEPLHEELTRKPRPESAALQLALLFHFDALTAAELLQAFQHESPLVRLQAVKLAGLLLNGKGKLQSITSPATLNPAVLEATGDQHPHVRYKALIALRGKMDQLETGAQIARQAVLQDNQADPWMQKASLLGLQKQLPDLLSALVAEENSDAQKAAVSAYAFEVSQLIGRLNDPTQVQQVLALLWKADNQPHSQELTAAIVRGLGAGLRSRGGSIARQLQQPIAEGEKSWLTLPAYQKTLQQLMEQAQGKDLKTRLLAIETLSLLPDAEITKLLVDLAINTKLPANLRTAALKSLQGRPLPEESLREEFVYMIRSEAPSMRRELIDYCLSDGKSTIMLLESMSEGELNYRELASDQVTRLNRSQDKTIKELHEGLKAQLKDTNREQVIAAYLSKLNGVELTEEQGLRGREIFKAQCATCHKMGEDGTAVGPDISDTRTKRPDELLVSILDPNKAIDNNFFSYTAVTIDGKIHTGILAEETPFSITLKQAKGETRTLQREEIEEFASDGVSFMPIGLEKNITQEQMIDLISFLKNWRYLEGKVPLK